MRRIAVTVAIATSLLVGTAAPASAHGARGFNATNYRTRLSRVTPTVPGVTIRVVEFGNRIEVANHTSTDVIVTGYQAEPYLRLGPGGVYENLRSPATYLNRTRAGGTAVPGDADPKAAPEWRKVSDTPVARWHDHRVHWMGEIDPPTVRRDPHRRHVVIPEWKVEVRAGDTTITAFGDLMWIPGPSPWPWLLLAAALLAIALAVGLQRWWARGLAALVAMLVVTDAIHAVGVAFSTSDTVGSKLGQLFLAGFFSVVGWIAGGVAVVLLARRRVEGIVPAVFAALAGSLYGGVVDLTDLTRSQVPFSFGVGLARFAVAIALGLGVGILLACGLVLRRERPWAVEAP